MDVVTPLMQTLQAQATLEHTRIQNEDIKALGQQRQINAQLLANQLQQNRVTTDALNRFYAGRPEIPNDLLPSASDSPIQAAQKNVARLQAAANEQQELVSVVARAGGDPKYIDTLRDNATNASHRATQAQRELMAERQNMAKVLGGIANGATDNDSFQIAYGRMAQLDPELTQSLLWDRNTAGVPVWGDRSKRTMQTIVNQSMTADQQLARQIQAARELDYQREVARREKEDQRQDREADAKIELMRNQGNLAKAREEEVRKGKTANAGRPAEVKSTTEGQRKAAMSAVDDEFGEEDFEGKRRLANDVADRANKLVADAKNRGETLGLDEARDQALEELKGFVADKTVEKPDKLLGIIPFGTTSKTTKAYTKGGAAKNEAALPTVTTQEQYDALKPGDVYIWNGKRGVKK